MSDLPQFEAQVMMALAKACDASLTWVERPNHAGHLIATATLDDETGATIPGMTLQLELKKPVLVDRCLYELGLFHLHNGVRRRVYQLNVTPFTKRSHNSPHGPLYGPHEHVGTHVEPVRLDGVECGALDTAFNLYCKRINLTFTGSLNSPL